MFTEIAERRGLDFKYRKGDKRYVELGGSNRMLTLKLWYDSTILGKESFIKVQVNFVEKFCFGIAKKDAKGFAVGSKKAEELSILFPEYKEYTAPALLYTYDIKELLAERRSAQFSQGEGQRQGISSTFT